MGTYNPIPLDDGIKEVRLNVGREWNILHEIVRSYQVLVISGCAAFRDSCNATGKSMKE